jgi:hypothetical protein
LSAAHDIAVAAAFGAAIALAAWLVWLQRRRDHRMGQAVERSFRRMSVTSDGVRLTGADLVVVKRVQQFMDANYDASLMFESDAMNGSNAFWYCRGPGGRWFLAIPSVSARHGRIEVQWVVRPLTEQRVRAVLRFDRATYRRVFGASSETV